MTHKTCACTALIVATLSASTTLAQDYSPYLETTGRGAYDLYTDAVQCNAVLNRAFEADPQSGRHANLQKGLDYTSNFAQFLLDSGDVVDAHGVILAPGRFATDLRIALANWDALRDSLAESGQDSDVEIARCLRLYGHDWE